MSCQQESIAMPTCVIEKAAESKGANNRFCKCGCTGKFKGSECILKQSMTSLCSPPDLRKTKLCPKFIEGTCEDGECNFAHGEEELRERPVLKKQLRAIVRRDGTWKKEQCTWFSRGLCRSGAQCGFAHGVQELRKESEPSEPVAPPPGLELPEEPLMTPQMRYFKMMAGRGASPLAKQVEAMTSAIVGLQEKLSQLKSMMSESQVAQMQKTISDLSTQCQTLEKKLAVEEQGKKSQLNGKAAPFVPKLSEKLASMDSDGSTSASSE